MKRKKILFGFSIIPYPLRSTGQSLRYLPIIQYLSNHHDIDLIIIDEKATQEENVSPLYEYCGKIFALTDPRYNRAGIIRKLVTYTVFLLPWTSPISFISHDSYRVTRAICETMKKSHYDVIVWVGPYMLPSLITATSSFPNAKVIVDFVDSPSLLAKRRKDRIFSIDLLEGYENWKIRRWENKIIRKVDTTVYISGVDANTTSSKHTPGKKRYVVPNGIHIDSYSKERKANVPSPNIGFLGNMSYPPNIEAVQWLYDKVFIPLKKRLPDLSLVVIGRDPVPSIIELDEKPGVLVTGTVEDLWPYINAVDIFVFPLWRGAGLKNKILEAMYAGRPVITTEIGNEGIDAVSGRDLFISKNPEDFQKEICRLLSSPDLKDSIGKSAHSYVNEKFSWDRILNNYEKLITGDVALQSGVSVLERDHGLGKNK